MMRNSVVLPHPDGPTRAPTSPFRSVKASPSSTCRRPPEAERKDFCLIATSSRLGSSRLDSSWLDSSWLDSSCPGTPTGDLSFKRLHQECFDYQHDCAEGESIGEYLGHVEQLECDPDLEPHAVGTPEQFDDKHDLPDQR